jgi:hypothetical protein
MLLRIGFSNVLPRCNYFKRLVAPLNLFATRREHPGDHAHLCGARQLGVGGGGAVRAKMVSVKRTLLVGPICPFENMVDS